MRVYTLLAVVSLSYGCLEVEVVEEDGSFTSTSRYGADACFTVKDDSTGTISFQYVCDGGDAYQEIYYQSETCIGTPTATLPACDEDSETNTTCTSSCVGSGDCRYGFITVYDLSDTTCSGDFIYKFPGVLDSCDYGTVATCTGDMVTIDEYDNDECTGTATNSSTMGGDGNCDCDGNFDGCVSIYCPTLAPTPSPVEVDITVCSPACEATQTCTADGCVDTTVIPTGGCDSSSGCDNDNDYFCESSTGLFCYYDECVAYGSSGCEEGATCIITENSANSISYKSGLCQGVKDTGSKDGYKFMLAVVISVVISICV